MEKCHRINSIRLGLHCTTGKDYFLESPQTELRVEVRKVDGIVKGRNGWFGILAQGELFLLNIYLFHLIRTDQENRLFRGYLERSHDKSLSSVKILTTVQLHRLTLCLTDEGGLLRIG